MTGATKLSHFQSFQTQMETARLSRPTWKRRDFKKIFQGFFSTKVETARLKKNFRAFSTEVETARLKKFLQGFFDRGGDGATFATMVDRRDSGNGANQKATARPAWPARTKIRLSKFLRPGWRRRDFPDRGGDGANKNHFIATVQTKAETARLSRTGRDGATKKQFFATLVDAAQF